MHLDHEAYLVGPTQLTDTRNQLINGSLSQRQQLSWLPLPAICHQARHLDPASNLVRRGQLHMLQLS